MSTLWEIFIRTEKIPVIESNFLLHDEINCQSKRAESLGQQENLILKTS